MKKFKVDQFMIIMITVVIVWGLLIFYKIFHQNYFYMSKLGDMKEQYINFFNLYHHLVRSGELPFWSWNYGPGGSFWNEFGYYVLGDIFIWPLLLFPVQWFPYLFIPMSIVKLCLMALGMYLFLKEYGIKRHIGLMAGISYSFAVLFFENFYTHYFFANPAIFFPFVLYGYERYINKKKSALLIITLFLTCISNFYFLFMITLGLGFYSVFRYFTQSSFEKSIKGFFAFHLKLVGLYLLAFGLSLFILLPSVYGLFESNVFVRPEKPPFEPILQFDEVIRKLIWSGGINILPFVTIPLLLIFNGRKNFIYGIMGVLLLLCLRNQKINSIIGAISSPEEFRAFFLFNAFFIMLSAIALNSVDFKKKRNILVVLYLAYYSYNWIDTNPFTHYVNYLKYIPIAFVLFYLIYSFVTNRYIKTIAFGVSAFTICFYSLLIPYSFVNDLMVKTTGGNPGNFHKGVWGILPLMSETDYKNDYENEDVKNALANLKGDSDFYRIFLNDPGIITHNSSMTYQYHSYYTYQSLVKWDLQKFEMDDLGQLGSRTLNLLRGYPNSTIINTLLNNKYYVSLTDSGTNMFGYKPIKRDGNLLIEQNQFALPIGFLYDHAISNETFKSNDFALQEESMLRNAVIPNNIMKRYNLSSDSHSTIGTLGSLKDAVFSPNTNSIKSPNGILVNSNQPIQITIPLSKHNLSEMEVLLNFTPYTPNDGITVTASSSIGKMYSFDKNMQGNLYIKNQYQYRNTVNKVLFRFGADKDSKWIKLVIQPGSFLIKDLRVTSEDYHPYEKLVQQYRTNRLKSVNVTNNSVSGDVKAKNKSILFLSIPFSKGWQASIDGKKAETFRVHSVYTGIYVPKGNHHITLSFIPEGFTIGITLSIISLIIVVFLIFRRIREKKDLIERREL